jgi:hypothetical protein
MPNHKYVIKIDDKIEWEGLDIVNKFRELQQRYPDRKLSIAWVPTKEEVLIV